MGQNLLAKCCRRKLEHLALNGRPNGNELLIGIAGFSSRRNRLLAEGVDQGAPRIERISACVPDCGRYVAGCDK
jgi:hypothetical protein